MAATEDEEGGMKDEMDWIREIKGKKSLKVGLVYPRTNGRKLQLFELYVFKMKTKGNIGRFYLVFSK